MPSTTKKARLPLVVLLLAIGTFLMSTTEFVIAGLLPNMASDLGVSVSQPGLLITAFAIGMIVGAPTISVATMRLPKRLTLILSLLIFAVGHIVAAREEQLGQEEGEAFGQTHGGDGNGGGADDHADGKCGNQQPCLRDADTEV